MSKYEVKQNSKIGFLKLLYERETRVDKKNKLLRRKGLSSMAASVPWNLKRIQNAVLSVGPGTPASTTIVSSTSSSSSSNSSASSESDDSMGMYAGWNPDYAVSINSDSENEDLSSEQMQNILDDEQPDENEASEGLQDVCQELSSSRRRQRRTSESSAESSTYENAILDNNNNNNNADFSEIYASTSTTEAQTRRREESYPSSHNANDTPNLNRNRNLYSRASTNTSSPINATSTISTHTSQSLKGNISLSKRPQVPALKHDGCINTATWLTCPWRLSTASNDDNLNSNNSIIQSSSYSSNNESTSSDPNSKPYTDCSGNLRAVYNHESPTQLVTSGDDRLIKFWDVSASMGMTSLCNAGQSTAIPFSNTRFSSKSNQCTNNGDQMVNSNSMTKNVKQWKQHHRQGKNLSGSVVPLATLLSGHRGNVFHVTPIPNRPGKIASCAADGFLRLSDIEQQLLPSFLPTSVGRPASFVQNRHGLYRGNSGAGRSTTASQVIVSPEFDGDERQGLGALRSSMCYSHCFLNNNVGLLCSERGLRKFDVRLPPVSQPMRHVFWDGDGGSNSMSACGMRGYARRAGIRKTCKACAIWRGAKDTDDENLDSYYVFAGGSSGEVALFDLRMDGPSRVVQKYRPTNLTEISHVSVSGLDLSRDGRELLVSYENDQIYTFPIFPEASKSGPTINDLNNNFKDSDKPLPELAVYGAHLNRYTFLKNAKYAGPNDEYICTGSDSGHAWIYERSTGDVAALLKADQCTCNGVIPHPTLPFFVTYGIDSTAKLWRGTIPVDDDIDDSPSGRAQTYLKRNYNKSLITRHWRNTQCTILELSDVVDKGPFLPDRNEQDLNFIDRVSNSQGFPYACYIANDTCNIAEVLQLNSNAYTRSLLSSERSPVQSGFEGFSRRVGLIRLRNQATQLGLISDPIVPWIMHPRSKYKYRDTEDGMFHPSDLVPDYPSDWIRFDMEMTSFPSEFGMVFNSNIYKTYFADVYQSSNNFEELSDLIVNKKNEDKEPSGRMKASEVTKESQKKIQVSSSKDTEELTNEVSFDTKNAWNIIFETILLLKEGGNEALKNGFESLAANRYDKGLRYCAVAFMVFPYENLHFLKNHQLELVRNAGREVNWTPLLKTFISIRLNLSLTMLKVSINDRKGAMDQAQLAVEALEPFCRKKGLKFIGENLSQEVEEPIVSYIEAKDLQAKAYFRLGSAKNSNMDYECAIKHFEKSIECKKEIDPNGTVDPIVSKRLAEAKKNYSKKKKRQRKKFKSMFSSEKNSDNQPKS